jgi:hypothetical protein
LKDKKGKENNCPDYIKLTKHDDQQGVVEYVCNPSTEEDEVRGSLVQGQPGLHNETHLKKKMPTKCSVWC